MTASAWTRDRIERLTTLWNDGKTAEQVARELGDGISRSAVLGKVYRMGLSHGRVSSPTEAAPPPRAATRPRPPRVRPTCVSPSGGGCDRLEETGRASLLTVGRHQCRWPIGDPRSPAFSLCGRASVRGAYCAAHAEIAYRTAAEAPRALERLAGLV